jgi:DASS family divalent anion:Na+ symporter
MLKKNPILQLLIFLVSGAVLWLVQPPSGLGVHQWHLFVVFILTVAALIVNFLPMSVVMLISIMTCILTKIASVEESLSGFSSSVVWLVIMAFFIARAIIKSNLANRLAYYMIGYMGNSILGLSYSLVLTEFLLSPAIPSATARSGGIIFPIAKSMSDQFCNGDDSKKAEKIREFIMQTCFQSNVICSAMFLTAMAGNPLILQIAAKLGVKITWKLWAIGGIVPGITNLLIMPLFLQKLIKPSTETNSQVVILAKKSLVDMGRMGRDEFMVLGVFILLITMWIFGDYLDINATTTAIIGFLLLVISKVITWEDAISEKNAWNTFVWFSLFITLSNFLSSFGVTEWIGHSVQQFFIRLDPLFALPGCLIVFFYLHYLFASITVFATVMYSVFFFIVVSLKVNPFLAAMVLAYLANLSGGLSHYTISSAPIFFTGSKLSIRRWLSIGLLASFLNLLVWSTVGVTWWYMLGWIK